MSGARFNRVLVRRQDLRRPFPPDFASRLTGTTVRAVTRRAKYLVLPLSTGETLVMHLGMSGGLRVERADHGPDVSRPGTRASRLEGEASAAVLPPGAHDHVVFDMSSGYRVTFTDPRRFGVMDLMTREALAGDGTLSRLGPEPLSAEFDAAALAHACARRRVPLKMALLDQRVVAGLGNIYAVEALHRAGLSPSRRASTIATATGKPRPGAARLASAIKQVLSRAIERQSRATYGSARFRVYDREGHACPTRGCAGVIRRSVQGGRSTFACPSCQR